MKKTVCALLAIIMLASVTSAFAEVNMYGWEVPEETISFSVYRGSSSPDDYAKYTEKICAYLLENFNVDIDLIVYEDDETQRLNLMLASNDYPDVIISSVINSASWLEQGRAQDLTEYIESGNYETLVERYGKYLPRYYDEDGHIYMLGKGWGQSAWADYAPQLRLDWYKELGEPEITTPASYYEVLKQMIAAHPTNDKGEQTYAFGGYVDSSYSVMRTWLAMWGIKKFWKYDEDNNMTYWIFTDEAIEAVKFLNQVNRDGLLDPDMFTMNSEEFGDRVTSQRYAGFVGNWWICGAYGHEKWAPQLGDDFDVNMRYFHINVEPEGVTAAYNAKNTNGSRVIITDKAKDVAGIMKWFDFENSEMGTRLVGYGLPNEEGSVWNVNEDGTWEWVESQLDIITTDTSLFNWEAMELLGGQAYCLISAGVEPMSDGSYYWYDQSNVDGYKVQKDANLAPTIYDSGAFDAIILPTDTLLPTIKTSCESIAMTALANAIFAGTEEEAIQIITDARTEVEAAGIDELTEYYQTQYQSILQKWGK